MTKKQKKEAKKMDALKKIQQVKKKQVADSNIKDPLATFGIGIISYRNTLFMLFTLFAVLSAVSIPMKNAYTAGDAISSQVSTIFGRESISNLGYASV